MCQHLPRTALAVQTFGAPAPAGGFSAGAPAQRIACACAKASPCTRGDCLTGHGVAERGVAAMPAVAPAKRMMHTRTYSHNQNI